jgi:histidyl-tRNA synthetase
VKILNIKCALEATKKMGLKRYKLIINHVQNINNILKKSGIKEETKAIVVREMDKVGKKPEAEINKAIFQGIF